MSGSAAQQVISDLSARAQSRRAHRRARPTTAGRLEMPDPASIRILSERGTFDRCAAAVAADDASGWRHVVIGVFAKDREELFVRGGSEGPDHDVPGRKGPYLGLYAYADGHFFAGGRLQSAGLEIARVRLVWEDGYELQDTVENGVVMFLGARPHRAHRQH
jgi:hypothetical protein